MRSVFVLLVLYFRGLGLFYEVLFLCMMLLKRYSLACVICDVLNVG